MSIIRCYLRFSELPISQNSQPDQLPRKVSSSLRKIISSWPENNLLYNLITWHEAPVNTVHCFPKSILVRNLVMYIPLVCQNDQRKTLLKIRLYLDHDLCLMILDRIVTSTALPPETGSATENGLAIQGRWHVPFSGWHE